MVAPWPAELAVGKSALPAAAGSGLFPARGVRGGREAPLPTSCTGFGFVYFTSGVTFSPACTAVTTSTANAETGPGELHMLAAVGEDGGGHNRLHNAGYVRTVPTKPADPREGRQAPAGTTLHSPPLYTGTESDRHPTEHLASSRSR